MILFFYNLALLAALVVGAPWWLWRMATTQKYREGLRERLGRVPKQLASSSAAADRPTIWIHAVSVGEVLAVTRLVKALDAALPDYLVAVSTTTRTGQALARERFGANRVFYCPLDLPWAVRAYLRALKPQHAGAGGDGVLAESARRMLSPRHSRGGGERAHLRSLLAALQKCCAACGSRCWAGLSRVWRRAQIDAERLLAIGCAPERVSVAGNLKFDVRAAEEAEATRLLKTSAAGCAFVVAGSTLGR